MLITTQNEIISLMPTARWDRASQLFGYLEEEERVTLEPLLGTKLFLYLLTEYERLRKMYIDITASTIRPNGKAKQDARLAHAEVTERIEQIHAGNYRDTYTTAAEGEVDVPESDLYTIRLIRICQQIEFYKMLSHKAGLLTVSFNEGGGMNTVSADGYEPADEKRMERVVKDAYMSAGRAIDTLLLFLEGDAKGKQTFTEMWSEADAFYLHKDLLFQTARMLNEYLDTGGDRMAYVALVRDIRFCQNTYLKPRVGKRLLQAVIDFANGAYPHNSDSSDGSDSSDNPETPDNPEPYFEELLSMLRTALAFYVESRRVSLEPPFALANNSKKVVPVKDKLARRDSMTDAEQAMAMACAYIEENIDALGPDAVGSPIYKMVREKEAQEARDRACACAAAERKRREACEQNNRKLFTGFPATHRRPEYK